ncbi:hypothetical protein C362_00789 [Cryptococcus neoformans Bt1]|nr:hypothetical protein C362_00789 [Cryptococcus neoformans var. grubii Bt1]
MSLRSSLSRSESSGLFNQARTAIMTNDAFELQFGEEVPTAMILDTQRKDVNYRDIANCSVPVFFNPTNIPDVVCYGIAYPQADTGQCGREIYNMWHFVTYRKDVQNGEWHNQESQPIARTENECTAMTVWPTRMIVKYRWPSSPELVLSEEILVCEVHPLSNPSTTHDSFENGESRVEGALVSALDTSIPSIVTGQRQPPSLTPKRIGSSLVSSHKTFNQPSASLDDRRIHPRHSCPSGFPTLPRRMHPLLDAVNDYITCKGAEYRSFERRMSSLSLNSFNSHSINLHDNESSGLSGAPDGLQERVTFWASQVEGNGAANEPKDMPQGGESGQTSMIASRGVESPERREQDLGQTQGISQLHRSATLPSSWAAWRSDILTEEWAEAAGGQQMLSRLNARLGDVSFSNIQDLYEEATNNSPNTILSQSAVHSWTPFLDFSPWRPISQDSHNFSYRLCANEGLWEFHGDIPIDITLETVFKLMIHEWLECSIDRADSPASVSSERKLARAVRFTRGLPMAMKKVLMRDVLKDYLWEHVEDAAVQKDCPICQEKYQTFTCVTTTPCQHMFHKACLDQWTMQESTCPMCRRDWAITRFLQCLEQLRHLTGGVDEWHSHVLST